MQRNVGLGGVVQGRPGEAAAYTILEGDPHGGIVLLCDHASNALPERYGALGLSKVELERHIAYDIGAAIVVRRLQHVLRVPAVLTTYSRLLIDCNRGTDDPTLIMRLSDGSVVPGNRHVDAEERERRIRLYYEPYHAAIDRVIDAGLAAGVPPALISFHSFTPTWRGVVRPWHAGVLWDSDPRLAKRLLDALSADADLVVGDNEPYSGRLEGDCMWRHGTVRGLAHAIVELRQDLITLLADAEAWGDRFAAILTELIASADTKADLQRINHYGAHAR